MKQTEIFIIGGGASGMMAAIAAARRGAAVHILEKGDRLGRKLLATGNGRCNYTNISCSDTDFSCSDESFPQKAYNIFNASQTISFFEILGILPRVESEGRVYPYSEQASAMIEALTTEMNKWGVKILLNCVVKGIKLDGTSFVVQIEGGKQFKADKIIVATGGKAGAQFGCSGDGYRIVKSFGHQLISPRPALVQIESDETFFKQLKGVRAKGSVTLKDPPKKEVGEIQFTESGLSGICIFNLSRYLKTGTDSPTIKVLHKNAVIIDLMPELSHEKLEIKLLERLKQSNHKTLEEFMNGLVNKKMIPILLKEMKVGSVKSKCEILSGKDVHFMASVLKGWIIPITGTKGWREAQVTAGGIDTQLIDVETMESKLIKGLHFAGEVLDVDGPCGGYNLQWAWTSGFIAGVSASEEGTIHA